MDFKFDFNQNVKVKLTDYGITILKQQREDLNQHIISMGRKGLGDYEVTIDAEGYSHFQLWDLMEKLGSYVSMDSNLPFHGDMVFVNGEVTSDETNKIGKFLKDLEELSRIHGVWVDTNDVEETVDLVDENIETIAIGLQRDPENGYLVLAEATDCIK